MTVSIVDRLDIPAMGVHSFWRSCYLFDERVGKLVWEGSAYYDAIYKIDFHVHGVVQPLMKGFPEKSR